MFDDFAPVRGDRDDKGVGKDQGQRLGIEAEFIGARMADEEEDIVVDVFDTGQFDICLGCRGCR